MKKNSLYLEWVEKAEGDYETSLDLRAKKKKCQRYVIAFHCQQCIEKYLKALLTFHRIDFPKHHDLEELMLLLLKKDPLLEAFRTGFGQLTPYAVGFRYPGDDVASTEVRDVMTIMIKLRKVLRERLGLRD